MDRFNAFSKLQRCRNNYLKRNHGSWELVQLTTSKAKPRTANDAQSAYNKIPLEKQA